MNSVSPHNVDNQSHLEALIGERRSERVLFRPLYGSNATTTTTWRNTYARIGIVFLFDDDSPVVVGVASKLCIFSHLTPIKPLLGVRGRRIGLRCK